MERRAFVKLCGGAAALVSACPQLLAVAAGEVKAYARVALVDSDGQPFAVDKLADSDGYIFHYPYRSTPALLLDLGRQVPGGVGPSGGIVAFAAICPHQFAYPSASLSALNYHPGESSTAGRGQAITCCLHGSAFDPAQEGAVLGGPALQALTVITLEYDAGSNGVSAIGTRGADIFPVFFAAFKRELREQYGRSEYLQEVSGQAAVVAAAAYSSQRVSC